ncbi:MAG: hypothetical protein ABEI52_01210 [Halobacteriaceae archaeon]
MSVITTLQLAGNALGVLGALLVFLEFFQQPSYLHYNEEITSYSLEISPVDPHEYTWLGRIGALLIAIGFATQFVALLL